MIGQKAVIFFTISLQSRLARSQHPQRKAPAILEGSNPCIHLQHGVTNSREPVIFIRLCKKFGFHDAGPVGEGEKFHRLPGNLMVSALLDDEAAGRHGFADEFAQAIHRAVSIPGNVREQFQRMSADRKPEQVAFPLQAFAPGWLVERDTGQLLQAGRRNKPAAL
jgi:hypothetical protein